MTSYLSLKLENRASTMSYCCQHRKSLPRQGLTDPSRVRPQAMRIDESEVLKCLSA